MTMVRATTTSAMTMRIRIISSVTKAININDDGKGHDNISDDDNHKDDHDECEDNNYNGDSANQQRSKDIHSELVWDRARKRACQHTQAQLLAQEPHSAFFLGLHSPRVKICHRTQDARSVSPEAATFGRIPKRRKSQFSITLSIPLSLSGCWTQDIGHLM